MRHLTNYICLLCFKLISNGISEQNNLHFKVKCVKLNAVCQLQLVGSTDSPALRHTVLVEPIMLLSCQDAQPKTATVV